MIETINKLIRTSRYLVQELGRDPTPEEIAERMEYPVEKVKKVLKIAKEPISLETPIGDEEDSSLGDFIEDKKAVAPAEEVINTKLSEQLAQVLSDLTPREEQVLRKRFGIAEKATTLSRKSASSSTLPVSVSVRSKPRPCASCVILCAASRFAPTMKTNSPQFRSQPGAGNVSAPGCSVPRPVQPKAVPGGFVLSRTGTRKYRAILLFCLALSLAAAPGAAMAAPDETPQESAHRTPAKTADLPPVFRQRASGVVAAALDGDTLKLKDGRIIRLACIDAPDLETSLTRSTKVTDSRDFRGRDFHAEGAAEQKKRMSLLPERGKAGQNRSATPSTMLKSAGAFCSRLQRGKRSHCVRKNRKRTNRAGFSATWNSGTAPRSARGWSEAAAPMWFTIQIFQKPTSRISSSSRPMPSTRAAASGVSSCPAALPGAPSRATVPHAFSILPPMCGVSG